MSLTFGTDGVRGVANLELSPDFALSLGRAAARVLGEGPWLVARDTRRSGPMLQAAFVAGLCAAGAEVVDLGVLPTPGVAFLAAERGLPGAMVSASHNPFADNGIKLFARGGRKLDDATEGAIERALHSEFPDAAVLTGLGVGTVRTDPHATGRYVQHLRSSLPAQALAGLHVVLDAANGAASSLAGEVFLGAGAAVQVLHAAPDGRNINDRCGSTHPEELQEAVRRRARQVAEDGGSDTRVLGLAFDGDADRVLAVAPSGDLVDGDVMMALLASDLRARHRLRDDTLVVTVMSNLGLRLAMAEAGINVVETKVGDRYVLEALEAGSYSLGGEQSGHVILRDLASTGDGMLTGLFLADLVARSGTGLDDLARAAMTRLPQTLVNVPVADRSAALTSTTVQEVVAAVEADLGTTGRVLLRPSGTEPLVRVMVEAPTAERAEAAAARIAAAVTAAASPS